MTRTSPLSYPQARLFWIPPALLLLSAAISKSQSPLTFLNELADYSWSLSLSLQAVVTLLLPALEMFLGLSLLLRKSRGAAMGSLLLLVIFSMGILIALPTGYLHRCGCLGPDNVDPITALIKNLLAILLLIIGFFPQKKQPLGANPWAAFALVAGASWSGGSILVVYAVGLAWAAFSGSRHVLGYVLSLLLGLVLHLAHFPILASIVIATVLYFFRPENSHKIAASHIVLPLVLLSLTGRAFFWPAAPESPEHLLKIGQPWPSGLRTEPPLPQDTLGRSLVLFLRSDCDECRDWMPRAITLSRNEELPPLTGLAPQSLADIENYRRREKITFPVYSVNLQAFDHAVRRTPLLVEVQNDTVKTIFEEGGVPEKIPPPPLNKGGNKASTLVDSMRVAQDFSPGKEKGARLVLWITGNLRGQWLPHAPYDEPLSGGLSRIARALDLYRQPGDLLVDLGGFRYPKSIAGESRPWRIRANGFLKAMVRMDYSAINLSTEDAQPIVDELVTRGQEYGLPFSREIVWGDGRILMTDVPEERLDSLVENSHDLSLILWRNFGPPTVRMAGEVLVLGMGDQGNCLGRVEITDFGTMPNLETSELSGWTDGKPWRHHPVREDLQQALPFKKKPNLTAYLWQVPESLTPEKQAETQRTQTVQELSDYYDLQELHRRSPPDYTGPVRCRECHKQPHSQGLDTVHIATPPQMREYPVYERCLSCHATGFGEPGGFLEPAERPDLLAVTCEACHGASAVHTQAGGVPYPQKPDSARCRECHDSTKRPGEHP